VSRYAAPLAENHDESHLTKFELLLEASLDLEAVPQEYLISAAYDSRLQVRWLLLWLFADVRSLVLVWAGKGSCFRMNCDMLCLPSASLSPSSLFVEPHTHSCRCNCLRSSSACAAR
jgi:hypothetical protein